MLGKKLQEGTSHKLLGGRSCKSSQSKALQTELELFKAFCWAFSSLYCWLVQSTLIYFFLSYRCTSHSHLYLHSVLALFLFLNMRIVFYLSIPHCCLLTSPETKYKINCEINHLQTQILRWVTWTTFCIVRSVLSRKNTSFCQSLSTGSKIMQEQWRKMKRVMQEYDL